MDLPPLTACITAGGQARRFGRDKALALWRGQPLIEHVAASFSGALVVERLVIAPPGRYTLAGWRTVADGRPGEGPLAGLETALQHASRDWVAFAGVDVPTLTPAYWQKLADARRPGVLSVQAGAPERGAQPLAALYHRDLLGRIGTLLDRGERRLRLACPPEHVALVSGLPERFFRNINQPDDLSRLIEAEGEL